MSDWYYGQATRYAQHLPPRNWPEPPDHPEPPEPTFCPNCDTQLDYEGDQYEGTETCPDCGFTYHWVS